LDKCRRRFDGGDTPGRGCFARRERATTCLTRDDVLDLEGRVDDFERDVSCRLGAIGNCPTPTPALSPTPTLTPTPTLPCVACVCPPPPTPATPVPTCTPSSPFGCPVPTASPPPCGAGFGPPSCGINSCPFRQVCTQVDASCDCAPCCPCP
jgi:hypothetical protein